MISPNCEIKLSLQHGRLQISQGEGKETTIAAEKSNPTNPTSSHKRLQFSRKREKKTKMGTKTPGEEAFAGGS